MSVFHLFRKIMEELMLVVFNPTLQVRPRRPLAPMLNIMRIVIQSLVYF